MSELKKEDFKVDEFKSILDGSISVINGQKSILDQLGIADHKVKIEMDAKIDVLNLLLDYINKFK